MYVGTMYYLYIEDTHTKVKCMYSKCVHVDPHVHVQCKYVYLAVCLCSCTSTCHCIGDSGEAKKGEIEVGSQSPQDSVSFYFLLCLCLHRTEDYCPAVDPCLHCTFTMYNIHVATCMNTLPCFHSPHRRRLWSYLLIGRKSLMKRREHTCS